MACGGCGRKHNTPSPPPVNSDPATVLTSGYRSLNDRQIRARLEVYKKNYCRQCERRYQCDFAMFLECKKTK
jgi:hypothetical protein